MNKDNTSTSYKARKEAFVSNLSGSSLTDINLVTLVAAVSPSFAPWVILESIKHIYFPLSMIYSILTLIPTLVGGPSVDAIAEETITVHSIHSRGRGSGLSAQCLCDSFRNHIVFVCAVGVEHIPNHPSSTPPAPQQFA